MAEIRTRAPGYQGQKFKEVLKSGPFPEFLKRQLFNILMSCSHTVLKDPVVFMLMVMIVIFKDPENVETNHISEQYWTMMVRWLERRVEEKRKKSDRVDTVEMTLPALARCINSLPIMMGLEHALA